MLNNFNFFKNSSDNKFLITIVDDNFIQNRVSLLHGFENKEGQFYIDGENIYIAKPKTETYKFWGGIFSKLPYGDFEFTCDNFDVTKMIIGFGLEEYKFEKYKNKKNNRFLINNFDIEKDDFAFIVLDAFYMVRDMINEPANVMTPKNIVNICKKLSNDTNGKIKIHDEVCDDNFPLLHTVGKASSEKPFLVDMIWEKNKSFKTITLIGKGVTFDSGGLDLKPSSAMLNMKKDMGGAANVIGLAYLVLKTNLNVNLRVVIPTCENMVSANSFKPKDILTSKSGVTIENGNTDAEGRLILADAIEYLEDFKSDITIDMATLTGAARVALGTDVPVFFSNDDIIAKQVEDASKLEGELVWRLPLHQEYKSLLNSDIADISSCGSNGMGGAITAALFLQKFIKNKTWIHVDMMAYNLQKSPCKPTGGEAQGLMVFYNFLKTNFS